MKEKSLSYHHFKICLIGDTNDYSKVRNKTQSKNLRNCRQMIGCQIKRYKM